MLRELMKERRVLAAYTAPPRPTLVEGADALGDVDALRTVHHVLHSSSSIKLWQRPGESTRVTLDASAAAEAQLVRAARSRRVFSCGCSTDASRTPAARRSPRAGPPCPGSSTCRPAAPPAPALTQTGARLAALLLRPPAPRSPRRPQTRSAYGC